MVPSRSSMLVVLAMCVGCDKPAAPSPERIDAPLQPASEAAIVVWNPEHGERGECRVVPCPSGSCRVVCPPREDMLVVDVQEPLRGDISIEVENVNVFRKNVPNVPTTGLTARVNVRPGKWPARVRVTVNDATGETTARSSERFVAARAADGGALTFRTSQSSPSYE